MEDKYFVAALQAVDGLGSARLSRLLGAFSSGEIVWKMPTKDIIAGSELSAAVALSLDKFRHENPDAPQKIAENCQRRGIKVCAVTDEEYPRYLKEIYLPPNILYIRGELFADEFCIGIVGSRSATQYGETVAERVAAELAKNGVTVVSGAARGIDSAAHRGALRNGRTIAVLGCGVDVAYPPSNRNLLEEIAAKGAIISEYAPGTQPLGGFFPARNRIIGGLSRGILVVEAGEKSGALITAEQALNNNRDVFAVPGNIFSPMSIGCHNLIRQGAKLTAKAEDILEEYADILEELKSGYVQADMFANAEAKPAKTRQTPKAENKKKPPPKLDDLSDDERALYGLLAFDASMSVDEIMMKSDGKFTNVTELSALLTDMSIKGLIAKNRFQEYIRA